MVSRGLSLANKCQLLFGAAVVLLISAALIVPWVRLVGIVDEAQLETSRQIARLWESNLLIDPSFARLLQTEEQAKELEQQLRIGYYPAAEWESAKLSDFEAHARKHFSELKDKGGSEVREFSEALWEKDGRRYRYAQELVNAQGQMTGVLVIDRLSNVAASQVFVNRLYLVVAGIGAGGLAVLVFYLITTRIVLSPVRALRDTAAVVEAGNLHVRSEIQTGDEFQELSEAFNSMLTTLADQQAQLRGINRSLDLKLTELAERNLALYEAARLKGEFLANISHELRTPLNSIIGFAEILQEIAQTESESEDERPDTPNGQISKRRRYLDNIVNAGRTLLEMINELLTMAKLDAGTIELTLQTMNVAETCDGLMALIRPLADRKRIRVELQLRAGGGAFTSEPNDAELLPVETDPNKFQQIVFNFLSNAVKFTPEGGQVTLRAEQFIGSDGEARVRIAVMDTGPGIPADKQSEIFEKFVQLEGGHTRTAQGTGLGLAIAKEFAEMIGGEIQLVSEIGRGSVFSLIVPVEAGDSARRRAEEGVERPRSFG